MSCLFIFAVALTPPVSGFEQSPYEAFGVKTWALFILVMAGGVVTLVVAASFRNHRHIWPAGLAAVLLAYAGFYAIPLIRGYVLYSGLGWDSLVHLGLIADILNSGELSVYRYPALHLLFVAMSLVTSLPSEAITPIITYWMFILFIGLLAACIWTLTRDRRLFLFVTVAAIPIQFGHHRFAISPYLLSMTLTPVLLLTMHAAITRPRRWQWITLYIFASAALILYHPLTMGMTLIIIAGYLAIYGRLRSPTGHHQIGLLAVSVIGLVSWHVLGEVLDKVLAGVALQLINPTSGAVSTAGGSGNYETWQSVLLYLENYGVLTLFFGLGSLATLTYLWRWVSGTASLFERFTAHQFVIAGVVSVCFFIIQIHGSSVTRVTQYLILISILAVGGAITLIYRRVRRRSQRWSSVLSVGVCILFITVTLFAAATAYTSNHHITEATEDGYGWHMDHKTETETVDNRGRNALAFKHYGYSDAVTQRARIGMVDPTSDGYPHRLGYNGNETVADGLGVEGDERSYLITRDAHIEQYRSQPDWRRDTYYTPSDRARLASDPTASRIYNNDEFEIWAIRASEDD